MSNYSEMSLNNGELITRDFLTQLTNNQDLIKENMVQMRNMWPASRESNNKILCGLLKVAPRKGNAWSGTIRFGTFFHSDCKPVVLCQVRSTVEITQWLSTRAIDGTHTINSSGAVIFGKNWTASGKKNNVVSTMYVDWVAFGW